MSDSLGLSIGVANLVAARVGSAPVSRRSVLTLFGHRAPEVGVPDENPNLTEPGLVLSGFIERTGDPAPFVASDGSTHRSDVLVAEALDAMARAVGYGAPVAVAVPAHWADDRVAALREGLQPKRALAPEGVPPVLISDATAALAARYAKPGFPTDGVVALCDFGASGTSVTLTDAAADFQHIGETIRYTDFSGDQIDQAILTHVQAGGAAADTDAAGTTPLGPLTRRLDQCRHAKEQLSAATVTVVPAEMPGFGEDVRLSRAELEDLISGPLERFVNTVEDILRRHEISTARLAAIATVGGGACIPLVTKHLSDRLQVHVVTTPQPTLSAAIGAAVLTEQRASASASAGPGPAATPGANADAPAAGFDTTAPTDVAPAAWAAGAAAAAAGESVEDGALSATYRALAWSQDASTTGEQPVPYTGEDHSGEYGQEPADAAPAVTLQPADVGSYAIAPPWLPWYKRSGVLFSLAAAAAAVALLGAGVLAFQLTANTGPTPTTNVTAPSEPSNVQPAPPPVTETVTAPSPSPSPSEAPIPAPSTTPETTEPPMTTTTTAPTTTTTLPTTTKPTKTTPPTTTFTYPPVTPTRSPGHIGTHPPLVPVTPTTGR